MWFVSEMIISSTFHKDIDQKFWGGLVYKDLSDEEQKNFFLSSRAVLIIPPFFPFIFILTPPFPFFEFPFHITPPFSSPLYSINSPLPFFLSAHPSPFHSPLILPFTLILLFPLTSSYLSFQPPPSQHDSHLLESPYIISKGRKWHGPSDRTEILSAVLMGRHQDSQ